jgi:hypothetical protein
MKTENSPRSLALVATRLIGLVALLGGVLALPRVLARHRALMRGETGIRPPYLAGRAGKNRPGRTDKKIVVVEQRPTERDIYASFISAAAALVLGLGFLLLARPISRIIARDTRTN